MATPLRASRPAISAIDPPSVPVAGSSEGAGGVGEGGVGADTGCVGVVAEFGVVGEGEDEGDKLGGDVVEGMMIVVADAVVVGCGDEVVEATADVDVEPGWVVDVDDEFPGSDVVDVGAAVVVGDVDDVVDVFSGLVVLLVVDVSGVVVLVDAVVDEVLEFGVVVVDVGTSVVVVLDVVDVDDVVVVEVSPHGPTDPLDVRSHVLSDESTVTCHECVLASCGTAATNVSEVAKVVGPATTFPSTLIVITLVSDAS